MTIPQAPWNLKGFALINLHLVDIQKVRNLIPSELKIIPVLPGKTIGCVYVSNYEPGSVIEYSELIVAPACVYHQGQIGGWISHIYVDNPDSVAGGREIWGLPKEMAEFSWENNQHVIIRQNKNKLCSLSYNTLQFGFRQDLGGSTFSTMGRNLLLFDAKFQAQLGLISSQLEVPTASAFFNLGLNQPFFTVRCDDLKLQVDPPRIVNN